MVASRAGNNQRAAACDDLRLNKANRDVLAQLRRNFWNQNVWSCWLTNLAKQSRSCGKFSRLFPTACLAESSHCFDSLAQERTLPEQLRRCVHQPETPTLNPV